MVKNSTKTNNVSFIQIHHCSGRKLKDSSEIYKSLYSDTSVTQRQSVYGSETISQQLLLQATLLTNSLQIPIS